MSTYKHNCTKGPATYKKREVGIFCDVYSTDPGEGGFPSIARTEDEANAELIAEAFSVLAETGMTPRELAERLRAFVQEVEGYGFIGVQGVTKEHENHFSGSPSYIAAKELKP